jgi:hypothetical protein
MLSLSVSLKSRPVITVVNRILILFLLTLQTLQLAAQPLPELIPYRKGKLWGFADSTGKIRIEPQWGGVHFFEGDYARISAGGKNGLINRKGEVVVKPDYLIGEEIAPGYYCIGREQKGVINRKGQVIIKPVYESVMEIAPGYFRVKRYNEDRTGILVGLVDSTGKELLPASYYSIEYAEIPDPALFILRVNPGSELLLYNAALQKIVYQTSGTLRPLYKKEPLLCESIDERYGLVNAAGRRVIPAVYLHIAMEEQSVYDFRNDSVIHFKYIVANKSNSSVQALFDSAGKPVLDHRYDRIDVCQNGFIVAHDSSDQLTPVMDLQGHPVLEAPWDIYEFGYSSRYFIAVKRSRNENPAFNVYDALFKRLLFTANWDEIRPIKPWSKDPQFLLRKGNTYQLCDTLGNAQWERTDLDVYDVTRKDSFYLARINGLAGVYRPDGAAVFETEYRHLMVADSGYFLASSKHTPLVLLTRSGRPILEADGVYINRWGRENMYIIKEANQTGVADLKGNVRIPAAYKTIQFRSDFLIIQDRKRKYAVFSALTFKPLSGFEFDKIELMPDYGMLVVTRDGKKAIMNSTGQIITPWDYYSLIVKAQNPSLIFGLGVKTLTNNWEIRWSFYDENGTAYPLFTNQYNATLSRLYQENYPAMKQSHNRKRKSKFEPPIYPLKETTYLPLYQTGYSFLAKGFAIANPVAETSKGKIPFSINIPFRYNYNSRNIKPEPEYYLLSRDEKSISSPAASALGNAAGEVLLDSVDSITPLCAGIFLTQKHKQFNVYDGRQKKYLFEYGRYLSISLMQEPKRNKPALFCGQPAQNQFELIDENGKVFDRSNNNYWIAKSTSYHGIVTITKRMFYCANGYIDDTGRQYWEE